MDVKSFLNAARLRTLPLSISGILFSSLYAKSTQNFQWEICVLALITTVGLQVLSNFANDYGDGVKGTDAIRTGEKRMVSSGKISPKQMKTAIISTSIVTIIVAILLIYFSFGKSNFLYSILFFVLGIISIVAAIKYTVGKNAYGYSGFGDVFVFLFFGLLSVLGSYFLFAKQLEWILFFPAISIGLLSTAVLNLNNMRDFVNDKKSNKNTLVVKVGLTNAKKYHFSLIFGALLSSIVFVLLTFKGYYQLLFLIAFIPLIKHLIFVKKNQVASNFDGELKKVALSTFFFAILLGVSYIFS